jgi:hypothetical protein
MTGGNPTPGTDERRAPASPYEGPLDLLRTPETEHFTRVVAPLLVAFTLPTIAVIATTKDLPAGAGEAWRDAVLALLVGTAGIPAMLVFIVAVASVAVGPVWSASRIRIAETLGYGCAHRRRGGRALPSGA